MLCGLTLTNCCLEFLFELVVPLLVVDSLVLPMLVRLLTTLY